MKRNVSIQQSCNKIWSCLKSQLFTSYSRASAAIYAALCTSPCTSIRTLESATLLLIGFAFLLQNIYKFAKISLRSNTVWRIVSAKKGTSHLAGKCLPKEVPMRKIFLAENFWRIWEVPTTSTPFPPKSIRPLPQSIKTKSTNKLRLYIILVHLLAPSGALIAIPTY